MAEPGPINTSAAKDDRKALAKIAALGALLKRQAGAFLALSCPTDEAAREAATRREKLLLIPSTSAGNKCLTGPPSTTLMHAWEKVAGELKQIGKVEGLPWVPDRPTLGSRFFSGLCQVPAHKTVSCGFPRVFRFPQLLL